MTVAALALILALVVLIPVLAIVIDSPVGQALARRISGDEDLRGASARLETLENELRYLNQEVESLREEATFLRSLVEGAPDSSAARQLTDRAPARDRSGEGASE